MAAVGCDECRQSGYFGRQGIYEIMQINEGLREIVRPGLELSDLRALALKQGMRPLRISGAEKIVRGKSTIDEVLSVVPTA